LQIGRNSEKEQRTGVCAVRSARLCLHVAKKIEEILNTKPADLRDNHLVRIDTNILDRITIDAPGKTKTILARKTGIGQLPTETTRQQMQAQFGRMIDRATK